MNADPAGEAATLSSEEYVLHVRTAPFACVLSESAGDEPVWQLQAVRLRPAGGSWQQVVGAALKAVEPSSPGMGPPRR